MFLRESLATALMSGVRTICKLPVEEWDQVEEPETPEPEAVFMPEARDQLAYLFRHHLEEREAEVLLLRFGIGGGTHTLADVGKIFRICPERARNIEAKALRKLRHPKSVARLGGLLNGVQYEEWYPCAGVEPERTDIESAAVVSPERRSLSVIPWLERMALNLNNATIRYVVERLYPVAGPQVAPGFVGVTYSVVRFYGNGFLVPEWLSDNMLLMGTVINGLHEKLMKDCDRINLSAYKRKLLVNKFELLAERAFLNVIIRGYVAHDDLVATRVLSMERR